MIEEDQDQTAGPPVHALSKPALPDRPSCYRPTALDSPERTSQFARFEIVVIVITALLILAAVYVTYF